VAQEVREVLTSGRFDCVALPLPPSCEPALEASVAALPTVSLVILPEPTEPDSDAAAVVNFVPVDPCQAVIMGLRVAQGEGIPRAYIDREVERYEPESYAAPDPFALKRLSLATFASALLPTLPRPAGSSRQSQRAAWIAFRLHELELDHQAILCLCHLTDWPWVREAYHERRPYSDHERIHGPASRYLVEPSGLYFVLGELPFITELYERRRAEVRSDRMVAVDGIKELLLESRARFMARLREDSQSLPSWITPSLLQQFLQYVRNLSLLDRRLTPDLYTLVLAAQQLAGDEFAIALLETARRYAFQSAAESSPFERVSAGIGQLAFPDGTIAMAKNRLHGIPLQWRSLTLKPKPTPVRSRRWALEWNPYRQCSWPPEDGRIESFTSHVREQARAILGADLAKVEKFTTSVKDGLDLRETLRRWPQSLGRRRHGGAHRRLDLYVKEIPPARGRVEVVVFLFDTPADPSRYSWQATWFAEHEEESTLCFFATPFADRMVGPGIGQSVYGGAMFLFPPRPIPDVWTDPAMAFARTLEERLLAAAARHSQERHIALVTPVPPRARWRQIARRFGRRLVPIPLTRFSGQTVDRLRRFHVLNGHEIRSYASQFIRE
jgi:hypothetical protein